MMWWKFNCSLEITRTTFILIIQLSFSSRCLIIANDREANAFRWVQLIACFCISCTLLSNRSSAYFGIYYLIHTGKHILAHAAMTPVVGRTTQRLGSKIRQYMPKYAIGPHWQQDATDAETCNKVYSPKSIGFPVVGDIKAPAGNDSCTRRWY